MNDLPATKKNMKAITEKKEEEEKVFSKEQILNSGRYKDRADLVDALLDARTVYTLKTVDSLIESYMKRKVD